jgi:DNA replication protein DnaC
VQALEAGHAVVFTTLAQLADGLETGAQFHSWRTRLRRFLQPQVLVIDEIGYTHLTPAQAHALFELVNARYEKGAILLTSNTSFADWGTLLGNEVLAAALLDRLLHHAEVIAINGPSYRMKERLPTSSRMATSA